MTSAECYKAGEVRKMARAKEDGKRCAIYKKVSESGRTQLRAGPVGEKEIQKQKERERSREGWGESASARKAWLRVIKEWVEQGANIYETSMKC